MCSTSYSRRVQPAVRSKITRTADIDVTQLPQNCIRIHIIFYFTFSSFHIEGKARQLPHVVVDEAGGWPAGDSAIITIGQPHLMQSKCMCLDSSQLSSDLTYVSSTVASFSHLVNLHPAAPSSPHILIHLISNAANHSAVRCGAVGYRLHLQLYTVRFLDVRPWRETRSCRCLVSDRSTHS